MGEFCKEILVLLSVEYVAGGKVGEQLLMGELKFANGSSSMRYEDGDTFPFDEELDVEY